MLTLHASTWFIIHAHHAAARVKAMTTQSGSHSRRNHNPTDILCVLVTARENDNASPEKYLEQKILQILLNSHVGIVELDRHVDARVNVETGQQEHTRKYLFSPSQKTLILHEMRGCGCTGLAALPAVRAALLERLSFIPNLPAFAQRGEDVRRG